MFNRVVMASKEGRYSPCIALLDVAGNEISRYYIPFGANLLVSRGVVVDAGHNNVRESLFQSFGTCHTQTERCF